MVNDISTFEDCLEMLMEKATCKTPQEEKSLYFPFTTTASNDTTANDCNYQSLNVTSVGTNNEIPLEYPKGWCNILCKHVCTYVW